MNKTTNIGRVHRSGKRVRINSKSVLLPIVFLQTRASITLATVDSAQCCGAVRTGVVMAYVCHRFSCSLAFPVSICIVYRNQDYSREMGEQPPRGWLYMVFSFLFFLYLPQVQG